MTGVSNKASQTTLTTSAHFKLMTHGSYIAFFLSFATSTVLSLDLAFAVEAVPAAQTVSSEDLLIVKLSQVLGRMPQSDNSRVSIAMRLADLHAERARKLASQELATGCSPCTAGVSDRKQAVKLYEDVLPQLSSQQLSKVLPQVGHQYQLLNQSDKAESYYLKVLALSDATPQAKAEAELSIAEMAFKVRDFSKARMRYENVLKIKESNSKGLAAYRLAWSIYNQGQLPLAIEHLEKILTTPELGSRSAMTGAAEIDHQFMEEVSRDLATFLSKKSDLKLSDAAKLASLSPAATRLSNIAYLAAETERIGNLKAALDLWNYSLSEQVEVQAKLESQTHLAALEFDLSDKGQAVGSLERSHAALLKALDLYRDFVSASDGKASLASDFTNEIRLRLRNLIYTWNRKEKDRPSVQLVESYRGYTTVFPEDFESIMLLGVNERAIGQLIQSIESFNRAIELRCRAEATEPQQTECESALLSQIESAEKAQDVTLLAQARAKYLARSMKRTKELEVRYQAAHKLYEDAQYEPAFRAFQELALLNQFNSKSQRAVREQAADLALDALALQKQDALMKATIGLFEVEFPEKKAEFDQVLRTAVLNQAVQLEAQGATVEAFQALSDFKVEGSTEVEKIKFWKNKLILAEKLKMVSVARDASEQLLKIGSLSNQDREFALARQAWLAELVFDFDTAFRATEKLRPESSEGKEAQQLKLALYAELAQDQARLIQTEAALFKATQDPAKKAELARRQVLRDVKPLQKAVSLFDALKSSPEAMGSVLLELYGREASSKGFLAFLDRARKIPEVASRAEIKMIQRQILLREFEGQVAALQAHKLDSSNDKKLASSIKSRAALITKAEGFAARALKEQDWLSQVKTLAVLGSESKRFYEDLMSQPLPKGLSADEEQEYMQLLMAQASPYLAQSEKVLGKVKELWSADVDASGFELSYSRYSPAVQKLIRDEVGLIGQLAKDFSQAAVAEKFMALSAKFSSLSEAEVQVKTVNQSAHSALESQVAEQPFDLGRLRALLESEKAQTLERRADARATVFIPYLENRLQSLEAQTSAQQKSDVK